MKDITLKKWQFIFGCITLITFFIVILILSGTIINISYNNGKINFNVNGQNIYPSFIKSIQIGGDIERLQEKKEERQLSFTRDKTKEMRMIAHAEFREQLANKGVQGNLFENDDYKAYTHITYIAFDEAVYDAVERYKNDFGVFIREGKYDYTIIEIEFESYLNNGVLANTLNDVRIAIQREWLSNMLITSEENFEYMESIAQKMWTMIKDTFVGSMKIELEYEEMVYEKEQELKSFIQLLGG